MTNLLYALFLSLQLFIPSKVYAVTGNSPAIAPKIVYKATSSPEAPEIYVATIAAHYGVNPVDALFILKHESQDCVNMSGDDGISIGCWMFNLKANPEVPYACAEDLECSTNLAMQWIVAGRINAWSTWRFRCTWYKDAPDCMENAP